MDIDFLNDDYVSNGGTLVMLVGPPGSGKSTFAQKIVDTIPNYVIVSPDAIREEMYGDPFIQSHNTEVFDIVFRNINKYLQEGCNVVYDATNCRARYRYNIMKNSKDYAYRVICFMSNASFSECIRNNDARKRKVPESAIESMHFRLRKDPPTIFEGFDLIAKF